MPDSMTAPPAPVPSAADGRIPRSTLLGLAALALLFVLWRLPSMLHEPGWQDEECYAVPGLTILKSGVPQLPHLPSRNAASPYYRADEAIFLEPPVYFYVQSLFYALLPDTYGTARLSSAAAGVLLLMCMGLLTLRCGGTRGAAFWGVGLFLTSRWFYFNATAARPDTLCSAFGFLAILATESWVRTRRHRWLVAGGIAIGLGGLTHPFAMAYALQMAAWTFLAGRRWERLLAPLTLALVAMGVASLWLLLIVQYPEIFEVQFRNQFLHGFGGPAWLRLLWPWPSFAFHLFFLWPHLAPWQFLLAVAGPVLCLILGRSERRPLLQTVGWLSISGAWLICSLVGPHHPVFGYFGYPSALAFIGVGWGLDRAIWRLSALGKPGQVAAFALGLAVAGSMLLGSRIRMSLAYIQNWQNIDFDAPRFARALLDRLPPDATYLVDEEFSLDFLRAGRKTIAFRAIIENALPESTPYDYRIASRSTDRYFPDRPWNDTLQWIAGNPDDPFDCYAKVYLRQGSERAPGDRREEGAR